MKRKFFVSLAVAAMAASPANADNTDTKSVAVGGTIVSPLQITAVTNMVMPHLVKPEGAELSTSVTLGCNINGNGSNTVTYTRNGNPFPHGNKAASSSPSLLSVNRSVGSATGTCALITVTGQGNYAFKATIGTVSLTTGSGVSVAGFNCIDSIGDPVGLFGSPQLSSGTTDIRCGASVQATSSASSSYSASVPFTVTYD